MFNYMYAIDRSDEYLAHYGVKGMKWGVRKLANAIASKNSRRAERAIRKAQKKLAKMEKRGTAEARGKYAKRAALLGAGAAAAGGLAALGAGGAGRLIEGAGTLARSTRNKTARSIGQTVAIAGDNLNKWAGSNSIAKGVGTRVADMISRRQIAGLANTPSARNAAAHIMDHGARKATDPAVRNAVSHVTEDASRKIWDTNRASANKMTSGISNNTIARVGAGLVGAGLAGAAGYNAYRAATTKRAARKAAEYRQQLNQAVRGTQYANAFGGGKSGSRKRKRNRG